MARRWRRWRWWWRCTKVLRCDGSSVWLSRAREALPKVATVTRWRWGPLQAFRALTPLLTLAATAALAKVGALVTVTVALAGKHWLIAARGVADLRGVLAAARAGVGSRLTNLGAFVAARTLRRVGSSVWLSRAREALPKVATVTRWRWGPLQAFRALTPLLTLAATAALAKVGALVTVTVALAGKHWLIAARGVADLRGALAAARAGVGSRLAELGAFVAARTLRRDLVTCGPREWFHDCVRVTRNGGLFMITGACMLEPI